MSGQTLAERYFTATLYQGFLTAIMWHKTLEQAKAYAKDLRRRYSAEEIIVGERLE